MPLDDHAKDKLLRLLKERYDAKTNTITLVAERCPMKAQNKDYATYLLNVLVSESWVKSFRKLLPFEVSQLEPFYVTEKGTLGEQ